MATAVRSAAKSLGMPEEVMSNFLALVTSVQKAVSMERAIPAKAEYYSSSERLLEDLISEYDKKL